TLDRMNGRWGVLSPMEREAACRWGFPFVDDGWHPHLTIASIRPADWAEIESTLPSERPTGTVTVSKLQIFQLIDRTPHLLTSVELGNPTTRPRNASASVPAMNLTEARPRKTSSSIATLKERLT